MVGETACWQCRTSLILATSASSATKPTGHVSVVSQMPAQPTPLAQPDEDERDFSKIAEANLPPPKKEKKKRWTLTGEEVEVEDPIIDAPLPSMQVAGQIGSAEILEDASKQIFRLSYCKNCGLENEPGVVECRQCKQELEIVAAPPPPIEPLPRSWGFDLLGLLWIALGISAIVCGQFLVKADPQHPNTTVADYLWTGVVVCAPGVLVFLRHFFCKIMFWTMTLGSLLVWAVLGVVWITGHLRVSDNGQVGLTWLAVLSGLSVFSFFVVRVNDQFDFGS